MELSEKRLKSLAASEVFAWASEREREDSDFYEEIWVDGKIMKANDYQMKIMRKEFNRWSNKLAKRVKSLQH